MAIYLKIARMARELRVGRVLALTATATPLVAADIRSAFGIEAGDHVQTGFHRPNLDIEVTPCTAAERLELLSARLRERPSGSGFGSFSDVAFSEVLGLVDRTLQRRG